MTNSNIKFGRSEGFTLVELIAVMILLGIVSIVLFTRLGPVNTAAMHSSRDDLIAALFFAQQSAMMRPNITLIISSNSVSVNENNVPIRIAQNQYPLMIPAGVAITPVTLTYDKLGRTAATNITLTGSGNSSGVSATIRVEASGYAFAN